MRWTVPRARKDNAQKRPQRANCGKRRPLFRAVAGVSSRNYIKLEFYIIDGFKKSKNKIII